MPHKSLQYYLNTCLLKLAAMTVHILDKIRVLDGYKKRNKQYFERLFEENYLEKTAVETGAFSNFYIASGYWIKPDYFAQNYIFNEVGVGLHRKDVHSPNHNPFVTASYGLICYNHFVETKSTVSLEAFWKQVHALMPFAQTQDGCFWIKFPWDNLRFGLKAPWASGLMQSVVLSLFLRAWRLSGDEHWKTLSQQVLNSLKVPVGNGGVSTSTPEGHNWIEERPVPDFDGTLNGFVFSMIAVYEYLHIVDNSSSNQDFLVKLMESFFKSLPFYCFGRFMKYSRTSWQFHNIEYQGLYVYLFLHLYRLSGKKVFLDFARHFDKNTDWEIFYSFYGIAQEKRNAFNFLEKINSLNG